MNAPRVITLTPGTLATLRVKMPKGVKGKPFYVSGVVASSDERGVTLTVTEEHWRGPTSERDVTIETWRILSIAGGGS